MNHPLNQSNKLRAIIRFIRWQVASRISDGDIIYPWINNSKVIARSGETGITQNIYCGLAEFSDMAFLLHVLREDDLFLDIGANVGSYTILASSVIGAKTFAFEPVPKTYDRLISNILINNISERVVARNIAIGNSEGKIYFSSNLNCMNHVIAPDEISKNKIKVNVSTLDKEVSRAPFIMKIDVEGYEKPVLEGAKKILSDNNLNAIIIEFNKSGNRYNFDESEIIRLLNDYGFKSYSYDPMKKLISELSGANTKNSNTIFIKNKNEVSQRIQDAAKFKIFNKSI